MSTGIIKISVFEVDEIRVATKRATDGGNAERADIQDVRTLLNQFGVD
jgi:hypothetical protein